MTNKEKPSMATLEKVVFALIVGFFAVIFAIGFGAPRLMEEMDHAERKRDLRAYYGLELNPVTNFEKNEARLIMRKRLDMYRAALEAVEEERGALASLPPPRNAFESQERLWKIRDVTARYEKSRNDMAIASRIYYQDLKMESGQ